jgi:type I restriction enzyme, R subunit
VGRSQPTSLESCAPTASFCGNTACYYNNLPSILAGEASVLREESPQEQEERAALTLRIDQAMREKAPAGWKGDGIREKQVLNALFPIMSRDRQATLAVFEIIKNQPGY